MAIDKAIDSAKLDGAMTSTADAIRAKTGDAAAIPWDEVKGFADAVAAIETKPEDVEESDVNFYDYDGTLLHSWTLAETATRTELPPLPSHDGLICQGWNWTLDEIKALGRKCVVGANYITDDGKTRLYIKVTDELASDVSLVFGQGADQGVTVDWGDGSEPTAYSSGNNMVRQTHQYAPGDYVITLDPADDVGLFLGRNSSGENLLGAYNISNRPHCAVLRKVEIGRNFTTIGIGSYTFYNCALLETITVPRTATKVGGEAFNGCASLKAYVVPRQNISELGVSSFYGCNSMLAAALPAAITSIPNYAFRNCQSLRGLTLPDNVASIGSFSFYNLPSLQELTIPDAVTSIGANVLDSTQNISKLTISSGVTAIPASFAAYCYGLTRLAFPGDIASIDANAFVNCYSVRLYDFTHCTAVPTLANANAFTNINAACQIRVPAALADEWKAATNWATYADKIVGVDA